MTKNRREGKGGNSKMVSSSPRWILCRWISSFKRSSEHICSRRSSELLMSEEKRKNEFGKPGKMKDGESVNGSLLLGSRGRDGDVDDPSKGKSSSLISDESMSLDSSGRSMKELSINFGLGFSLAYLLAASKKEFDKMKELQEQAESLIKDLKDKIQRKEFISESSLSTNYHGLSITNSPAVGNTNHNLTIQNCDLSHHLVETQIMMKYNRHLESGLPKKQESALGIDQLEAELQTELERLQLNLDNEDSLEHQRGKNIEMVVENSTLVQSHGPSSGEVDDPQGANGWGFGGVSPNELERRLHELLEARQQERIEELESALECAELKLHQKEMEVSWLKGNAKFISQHVAEAKCLSSDTNY